MKRVLITGMSATGKSTAVNAMAEHGFRAVDTDTDGWSEWVRTPSGEDDWIWREDRLGQLLLDDDDDEPRTCSSAAARPTMAASITASTTRAVDRAHPGDPGPAGHPNIESIRTVSDRSSRILDEIGTVETLLRAAADLEIDTGRFSAAQVAVRLIDLVAA